MASSCHIGVIDTGRNRYRMWTYQTTLHARGVKRSRKITTFSHLSVNDNFMRENVKSILVVS